MPKEIIIEEFRTRKFPVPWYYERKTDEDTNVEYFQVFSKDGSLVLTTKFEHGAARIIQIVHQLAEYAE